MEQVVGYVLSKLYQDLKFCKTKNLKPYIFGDADYAKDKDNRRSISSQTSTLGGMLVGWNSKKQHTVSLSSCKSKYISYGEACQEDVFMNQLLDELLHDDSSVGALFLATNWQVSQRTKHIDIRSLFVWDLQHAEKVIGTYVQSEENMADGATHNLAEKLFAIHILSIWSVKGRMSEIADKLFSGWCEISKDLPDVHKASSKQRYEIEEGCSKIAIVSVEEWQLTIWIS